MDHSGDNDAGSGTGFSDIRPGNVASFSAENDRLPEMSGSGAAEISGREGLPAGSAEEQHDSQNGAVGLDVSVKQEKKPSPRMEKLRAYYAQLGQAREMMDKELEAALSGSTVEGEVEAKLYEFSHSWRSIADEISKYDDLNGRRKNLADGEYHVGQNMVGMDFSGQNLAHADFSAANLQDANFKDAVLTGTDFTGADLSGADLSGADLSDSIFAGAKLKGTNFTGANMEGVILRDADIEDAILIDIRMDELAIEELQALVEYLAVLSA